MEIEVLHHSCFLIRSQYTTLLVDPYLSKSQMRTLYYDRVVVSHGHIDHVYGLKYALSSIVGNKYVTTSTPIKHGDQIQVKDMTIIPIKTTGHPTTIQKLPIYDWIFAPFTKVLRCGENFGFVFIHESKTIYYTSDTMFNFKLFGYVEETYKPDLILYNVQPQNEIPKLIMTEHDNIRLKCVFSGLLVPIHNGKKSMQKIFI